MLRRTAHPPRGVYGVRIVVVTGGRVGVVVGGSVATVELVGGTEVDAVGGGSAVVVVSGGGGAVVGVVVCTGGEVAGGDVTGGLVPVLRGAVVLTGGAVVGVKTDDPIATVVDVPIDVVVVGPTDVVDGALDVVVGRTVVVGTTTDVGPWLATCCLAELSSPVATSNRSAAKAMVARA